MILAASRPHRDHIPCFSSSLAAHGLTYCQIHGKEHLLLAWKASAHHGSPTPWLLGSSSQYNFWLENTRTVQDWGVVSSPAADVIRRQSGDAKVHWRGFYSLKRKHLPPLLTHWAQVNPHRITETVTKKQASAIFDKRNRQKQGAEGRISCRDT